MSKSKIPEKQIYEVLGTLNGKVGLYIENCETNEKFTINEDILFPCASVIKIPMVAMLLKDGNEGRIDLNQSHAIKASNRVGGTGILCNLDFRFNPTMRDLGKLMIMLSDNTATNEVIDILDENRFNQFCKEQGYHSTIWQRKMLDFEAIKKGKNNYMSTRDIGEMLSRIAREEWLSKEICNNIFSYMCGQKYRNKLPAKLPVGECYEGKNIIPQGKVLVGNKTGDLDCIQHDVGIFELPDNTRYVIAIFTSDLPNNFEGIECISSISKVVYDAFK